MAALPRTVVHATLALVATVAFLGFGTVYVYRAFAKSRGNCSTAELSKVTSPDGDYIATIRSETCDEDAFFDLGRWTSYSVMLNARGHENRPAWSAVIPLEDDEVPEPPGPPAASWTNRTTLEIQIPSNTIRGAYSRQEGGFVLIRRFIPPNPPHLGRGL